MKEIMHVTVEPKNQHECGLGCRFLRRYDSTAEGAWWCTLFSTKLLFQKETLLIHRTPKCDGNYLFTMRVPEDEKESATFENENE